jgi:tetratricopeptide (TPR) repeat protein
MAARTKQSTSSLLPRRRLSGLFISKDGGPVLSSITAPAGFGKTCLLREIEAVSSDLKSTAVVYVDIAEAEHEPGLLLDLIRESIETAIPEADLGPLEAMRRGAPPEEYGARLSYVLSRVLKPLAVQHVMLLLDNLHVLQPGAPNSKVLAAMLQDRPSKVHFVLASRMRIPAGLDLVDPTMTKLHVTATDLAFSTNEIMELLTEYVDAEEIEDLVPQFRERTGGWPGLVGLLKDTFRTLPTEDARELLRDLKGSEDSVTDFVVARILSGFDEELQAFVKRISVFPRLTPVAREAVEQLWDPKSQRFSESSPSKKRSGRAKAVSACIEQLVSMQILVPSPRNTEILEFNQLVRGSLYRLLAMEGEGTVSAIHRSVGMLLVNVEGVPDASALDHLLAAGEYDRTLELLEGHVEKFFYGGQQARVRQWLMELDEALDSLPYWANYYRGRTAATYGDWDASKNALESCKKELLTRKKVPQAWRWHAKVSMGFAWMYWRRAMQSEARTYCRRGLDYLAQAERRGLIPKREAHLAGEVRLELLELLGTAKLAAGAYDRAAEIFNEALDLATDMNALREQAAALSRLGLIGMRQGRHRMAREHLQRAVELIKDEPDTDLFGRATYLLGFTLVMAGEFDEGIYQLHTAYDAVIDSGRPSTVARTLTTIGRVYGSLGLIDEASDCFTRALDLIMSTKDTRVKVEVLDSMATALAYNHRPHEAKLLLLQSTSLLHYRNRTDAHLVMLHLEAQATLDAAMGLYPQALTKVQRAIERVRQLGLHYDMDRLIWRKAMWLHQAFLVGDESTPEEAFELLDKCCERALSSGFIFELGPDAEALMYVGMCYGTESMKTYSRELLMRLSRPVDELGPLHGMSEETAARHKDYRRKADLDEEYVITDRDSSRGANARQVNQLVGDFGDDNLVLLVHEQMLVHKGDDISLAEKRVILPLLLYFLRHPEGAFTMRELAEEVWGAQDSGSMQTKVKVAISRLRALLGKERAYILTQKVDRGADRPVVAYGLDAGVNFFVVEHIETDELC